MLETDRLILRQWESRDETPFAALNADPAVMAHFPALLSREDSDAMLVRLRARWRSQGICFAAVERKSDGAFAGMVGLAHVTDGPHAGAVEIGWRLPRALWGQGYATEAARRWLDHGFDTMDRREIVAFTVPENHASRAVMTRLGMRRDPGRDFEHPALPVNHRLRPHLLYALTRADWQAAR